MSLQINQAEITRVLLADGWHSCTGFGIDAYEIGSYYPDPDHGGGWGFHTEHGGGQSGVCTTGFEFIDKDTGEQVAGPLTAILAVAGPGISEPPAGPVP